MEEKNQKEKDEELTTKASDPYDAEYIPEMHEDMEDKIGFETGQRGALFTV